MRAVEELDELLQAEDLLIAVGPAEADQIVDQGLGQQAVLLVLDDGAGAVALGELGAVGAEDHGHVAEGWHLEAQRLVDEDLARGVGDVVVAADDVGDAHVVVVHHHGHVVGGRAVGAADDHVVELGNVDADAPFDHVVEDHLALQGTFEAHAAAFAGAEAELAAVGVVAGLEAEALGALAHGVDLLRRAGAPVGVARLEQLVHVLVVHVHALRLVGGLAFPCQPQPLHGGEDGVGVLLPGSLQVCVFNAEAEFALEVAGEEPGEDGGAGAADVQVPRRAGGEAGGNAHGSRSLV